MSDSKDHLRSPNRREFISGLALGSAALVSGSLVKSAMPAGPQSTSSKKFKLNYAPHFGMFKNSAGEDFIDQLKFIGDQGFTAFEDNGMMDRPLDLQERIAGEMSRLGLMMGVFVAYADFKEATFVMDKIEIREMLVTRMKEAVEVANRVNAKWCTVVPGCYSTGMEWAYQTTNVIENLKWCAEVCEPSGLVMVLESLNPWRDHPGLFLSKIPQAYQICRAVNSPSCKILDDLYHQQITEGNLIPNMDKAWQEIGYFQVGDNPGRKEPTTGEINYKNVFEHIYSKGFRGIIGMEHGNSLPGKEGEQAVIAAYRYCDSF
jgi:hydroxypyruvate isomerase